ncbi:MAG: S8 family serine peptidase, partial [Nocardioidaceae bacterium]
HTASTAAGNSGVPASVAGIDFGEISGMAPAAKVASYKVCWEEEDVDAGGCSASDSVAAIDAAVKDGVDAINYSISGTLDNPIDPVEIAFMYAADAGVFVSTSAGNSGPDVSTVAHPSPWLTTVANATHYLYEGTVEFGNGDTYIGASVTTTDVPSAPVVASVDAKAPDATEEDAALCLPGTLDPAAVDGTIVICDRGENARVEKSQVVADAGGVAAIITNVPGGSDDTVADLHAVPTVHLRAEFRDDVYAAAAEEGATAQFRARTNDGTTTTPPPAINSGSSRGPSLAADGDLLKPDIAAPGTDVLAAVAPERNDGNNFSLYTGTSMSSPHIAGLGLLFKQKYPGWSPMQIKSAMMTTATNLNGDRSPFSQGAGFVTPRRFFDPGLVFDSDFDDWTSYLAGQGVTYSDGTPISDTPRKASSTNTPSIALNDFAGRESITRTVTNVDDTASTYTVSKSGLKGVKVTATPSSFTIAPGATQRIRLRFERSTAAMGEYATGNLVLADGSHRVRVPTVAKPSPLQAPESVRVAATKRIQTKAGLAGVIEPRVHGLVPAVDTAAEAENTERSDFDPNDSRNYLQRVKARSSTEALQVETVPDFPSDDLDLYVFDPEGALAGQSASAGSDESVTVSNPVAGRYYVFVQAWSTHDDAATTSFALRSYDVGGKDTGTLSVSPKSRRVALAESSTWRLATSGLDEGTPYLGVLDWTKSGKEVLAQTLVSAKR